MAKKKFYVVWNGHQTGIFETWPQCEAATKGFSGAKYKSFPTRTAAEAAFHEGADNNWGQGGGKKAKSKRTPDELAAAGMPVDRCLCVDAAWNATTKVMEYQGVWHPSGEQEFHAGPFEQGTNNLGEFLAIVEGLATLQQQGDDCPIYTDSATAIVWVRNKMANSKSLKLGQTGKDVNAMVTWATGWLHDNEYPNPILKWQTKAWGEIPADFGRK